MLINRTLKALTLVVLAWPNIARAEEQQTALQPEFCIEMKVQGAACLEALAREQIRNVRRLDALRLKCDDSRAALLDVTTKQLAQCEAEQDRIPALEDLIQKLQAAQTKNDSLTDLAERYESLSEELNTARFEMRALNEQLAELDGQNTTLRQQIIDMEQEIKLAVDADKIRKLTDDAACINTSVAETLASEGMVKIVSPSRSSAQSVLKKLAEAMVDPTSIRLGYVDQPDGTDCPFVLDMGLASLRWKGEPQDTRASLFSRSDVEAYIAVVPIDQDCADLSGSEDIAFGEVWVADDQNKLWLCDLSSGETRLSRSNDDIGYLFIEIEFLEKE